MDALQRIALRRARPHPGAFAVALAAVLVLLAGCGTADGPSSDAGVTPAPRASERPRAGSSASAEAPTSSVSPGRPAATPTGRPADAPTGVAGRVVFVDVGQGDAAIVRSGSWTALIDGGPVGASGRVEAALSALGVRRLDAVVVSHMHADHVGGLPDVVRHLRPRLAYTAADPAAAVDAAFKAAGTTVHRVRRGDAIRCGSWRARVLSPARLSGDANADSLVLLLEAGGRRFLFTGDCSGPNEAAVAGICARGPPVDVLKVAHHGSRHSTTTAFLEGVRPRVAVISVGRNPYGHPAPATVTRLHESGAHVYTTQVNGRITFSITPAGGLRPSFTRSSRPLGEPAE